MYGIVISFKDFKASLGIAGSPWVGLKHFKAFFDSYQFVTL
jgi:putative aldouronate transport system permease protein